MSETHETPAERRLREMAEDSIVTLEGLQAYAEARANGLTMFPGLSSPELTEWDDEDAAEWAEDLGRWGRRALALRALLARCGEDA